MSAKSRCWEGGSRRTGVGSTACSIRRAYYWEDVWAQRAFIDSVQTRNLRHGKRLII